MGVRQFGKIIFWRHGEAPPGPDLTRALAKRSFPLLSLAEINLHYKSVVHPDSFSSAQLAAFFYLCINEFEI